MKTATPVEKDNKAHQSQKKKQRQKEPMVIPLSEVEVMGTQTQKPEILSIKTGLANPNNNQLSINSTIPAVHGSNTIYDQGSEIMYGKLQESLAQTGDINHPDTKEVEKGYMTTLNVDQINDYQNLKSGNYLPKTVQEQAVAYQENKTNQDAKPKEKTKPKSASKGNIDASFADLSNSPATQLVGNFNAIQNNSTALLNNQAEKATGKLPKVNAKTGSAFSGSKAKSKVNTGKTVAKSSKKTVKSTAQKAKPKEILFPEKEPLKKVNYSFNSTGAKNGVFEKQAQNQFNAINLNTSAVPTTMQQNAQLDLSGEADTEHLSIEQNDAAQDMSIKKNQAAKDIHKDYGENGIIKKPNDETLKSSRKLTSKAVKKQPIEALKLEGIDEASINAQFGSTIQSKIGVETEKYQTAELEHNQKVSEQEKTAETQIGTEKDKSKKNQLKSVKDAQTDVNQSRAEWQNALNKTESDFAKKSGDHARTTLGNIKNEKSKGETTAQSHINKANEEARKKKETADKEAQQKKSEKKNESKGFFGWLADKASAFINALKDALNYIFTKLREAVKAIFDAAKKLILAALELARKAIVNFIKGFASLLKGFLDIALAAFPGIRDRLKAKIDKYVAAAEKLVNQTFEVFKKAVVAVIDFLAETVDTLLGALQAVYNFVLDAVDTIVVGIIKMLEFILDIEKQYNLFKKLITGIQEIWNNPKILENYVIGFIAPFIEKIPGEANSQFKKFFAQSGVSFAKHITGVWTHLQPILAYMAGNWWGEMKKMIWYLVWPFAEGGPVRTEAPKLWTLIPEIWNNISNNNFSKAVDGGLAWMQTLNTVVGTFSGWITIGSVLIGGIVGAFFGGVGAIPGVMAGLEFATAVGEGLLISMLATESSIILKSIYDILTIDDDGIEGEAIKKKRESNESEQGGEQSKDDNSIINYESNDVETNHDRLQYAYQRIANSGFALAIIGVFIALGYLATNIVKALKPKFSPKIVKFKAKVKNTKLGKAYSKWKAKITEKGYKDYRPEWMKKKEKSNIPEGEVKPIQTQENTYEESIFRQDNRPYSPEGSKEGRIKSHINEEGNLIPADKNGNATISDHVRGSEPMKSKSPYTSFSDEGPGIGKTYGDNVIEVDIKRLEADIVAGKVSEVEVLRPEKVQAELQTKIDQAMKRFEENPTPKNQKRVDDAVRDLNNSIRDKEILIKGEIPSEYFKVESTKKNVLGNNLPRESPHVSGNKKVSGLKSKEQNSKISSTQNRTFDESLEPLANQEALWINENVHWRDTNYGPKPGLAVTEQTIATGTVQMELHPNFNNLINEMEGAGYKVTIIEQDFGNIKIDPEVKIKTITTREAEFIRYEKEVILIKGMDYNTILHEHGHVMQVEKMIKEGLNLPTPKGFLRENGNFATTFKGNSNAITVLEYHNRLKDLLRLEDMKRAGIKVSDISLKQAQNGVNKYRAEFENIVRNSNYSSSGMSTIKEYIGSIYDEIKQIENKLK